ncbi:MULTISPECIES: hypothetical protein [Methanothermobacter]|jgi:hypothetical protein|uniref:Uncharacterized protein n=3 Tax=Methanothermobacter TaxID=145260 RepID=O26301_METTH|nr:MULTISPECIES: hypothetical protein [Methanothermobacter]MBC7110824.1 hypothetical protein [Methanothermobacter sp.]AAB84705.1 unknown [Methanothermobacter thermautotrophicus str. Delta H]MDK2874563.1 hypothetical protein [Methanothermobacter sp.]MDN5373579.1 hypothetical protein [Methanothermobacter sp.]REE29113.1 hypothetical protein C7452_1146 [Methanothermobacter defluvii]
MRIELAVLLVFLLMGGVAAHGMEITPESFIVIADNSTGKLARSVADDLGVNVTVYRFQSAADVEHELEHALGNPNKKILAVAYQDTVSSFLKAHPEVAYRVMYCSADEASVRDKLLELNSVNPEEGGTDFLTPFSSGALIGVTLGMVIGALWMKRKVE